MPDIIYTYPNIIDTDPDIINKKPSIINKKPFEVENTNPIAKQIVILCKMRLLSPALIGNGEDENSDSDVYVDSTGSPLLPGSSLTGVLRSAVKSADADLLFGKLINSKDDRGDMSPLWVYDSPLYQKDSDEAADIITIDSVSLDENQRNSPNEEVKRLAHLDHMNKVAARTGKFDFQAVERDSRFDMRLRLIVRNGDIPTQSDGKSAAMSTSESVAHTPSTLTPSTLTPSTPTSATLTSIPLVSASLASATPTPATCGSANALENTLENSLDGLLNKINTLYVGGKTSRGFGKLECTAIYKRVFINTRGDLDEWLEFKWPDLESDSYKQPVAKTNANGRIDARLSLDGSLLIRDDYSITGDEDYAHITSAGIPVIYGTSWAGAIRGGLARFLKSQGYHKCENYLDEVFGCEKYDAKVKKKQTVPSKIRIDASYFGYDDSSDNRHIVTRVKIDRWTGGAVDKALFTTRPQFGGAVTLTIHYPNGDAAIRELFILALQAIDLGIITLGGETSIGRGLFHVDEICIDGEKQHDITTIYNMPKEALKTCMRSK